MYPPPPASVANTLGNPILHKVLFCVALLSQVTIGIVLGPIANDLLRLQVRSAFYPETYREQLAAWSVEERARFEKHYDLDLWFHPLAYGSLFASWVTVETTKLGHSPLPFWLLVLIPIVAGLCDIGENYIQSAYSRNPEDLSFEKSRIAGIFAIAKWGLVVPVGLWCLHRSIKRTFFEKSLKRSKSL